MPRERRFFVPDLSRDRIELRGDEAYHLIHVLRLPEGDDVVLFDGQGRAVSARIAEMTRRAVWLDVVSPLPSLESPARLTVAVAVAKGDKMSLVVQKLTELGVTSIAPLVTERTEAGRRPGEGRLARWRRVALEASKQSGRSRIPVIETPRSLEEMLEAARPDDTILMAHPGAPPLPAELVAESGRLVALTGPEGGWAESELRLARAHSVGLFGLGPRTLRAETAAIAVAALLQFLAGDLGRKS